MTFSVFPGVVTPGNIDFKTAALNHKVFEMHFAAGQSDLAELERLRDRLNKAPVDQRIALRAQLNTAAAQTAGEFHRALEATDEADSFFLRYTVLTKIAETDDAAEKYAEAAKIYEQALALKPDMTLYDNLGKDLAWCGQVDAAVAAYKKSVALQSTNSADAYLNFGITFYNANRLIEAVAPLRKATELDPQYAHAWYLLGVVLVATAEDDQKNANTQLNLPPGTIEAFQKAAELDPHGRYGQQAREALLELQQIARNANIKQK